MPRALDRKNAVERLPELESNLSRFHLFHKIASGIKAVIPKTSETTNLLDRYLFSDEEAAAGSERRSERRQQYSRQSTGPFGADEETMQETGMEVQDIVRATSPWYIIGTSLIVEAVVVGFAAWIFCRRDY